MIVYRSKSFFVAEAWLTVHCWNSAKSFFVGVLVLSHNVAPWACHCSFVTWAQKSSQYIVSLTSLSIYHCCSSKLRVHLRLVLHLPLRPQLYMSHIVTDLSMANAATQSAQAAGLFDDTAPSPSSLPNAIYPRGLSQTTVIILVSIIPTVFAIAVIMGIVHCVRRRNKLKAQAQHQADIEKSLGMARRPVLTLDTDIPRADARRRSRSVSESRLPTPRLAGFVEKDVPLMPAVPESAWRLGRGNERPTMFTRNSRREPGVGGRRDKGETGLKVNRET
jgi:hypothetical protein